MLGCVDDVADDLVIRTNGGIRRVDSQAEGCEPLHRLGVGAQYRAALSDAELVDPHGKVA